MARTSRFEMRLTPELLESIDGARGDVLRTTWIEGAIIMRLAGPREATAVARSRQGEDGLRLVQPGAVKPTPVVVEAEPEDEPEPERQLDLGQRGEPEPAFPRRPPPRMTGGGKKR